MTDKAPFDPTRYLTKVSGRDYLEVKWRLVWLRSVHPGAQIETELIEHRNNMAIFRARVTLPPASVEAVVSDSGELSYLPWPAVATGWGSEGTDDFGDYLEKAETKALGRALAALGFGTQFCGDFEFGAEQQRMADSPVEIRTGAGRASGGQDADATARQMKYLYAVARDAGLDMPALEDRATARFGHGVGELGRREVSQLIEQLQAERGASSLAP